MIISEATNSSPVGYLEGIFIEQECRKKDMQKNFLKIMKNGLWEKVARNSQVTVS